MWSGQRCVAKRLANDWRHSRCTYDVIDGIGVKSLPVFSQTFGYPTLPKSYPWDKKSWGLMLLRSKLFLLSPAPNLSNARGGDPKAILGIKSPGGWCCFAANSFYCVRLPIYPMLEGGDLNAMLGVKTSQGLMLLRRKLFLLSWAPKFKHIWWKMIWSGSIDQ